VKTHLERLYRRLGVSGRTDAVAKGLRAGLID
jgi:DNA-binding CsgD family transcriptional regulator